MLRRAFVAVLAATALAAAGCGGSSKAGSSDEALSPTDPNAVSGDITVLTNRTDLVTDGTMQKYADEFRKTYPKVNVKFEGVTDYEGEVKIRMNTENYGDVLLIPNTVSTDDYPKYFASLGSAGNLAAKYNYTDKAKVGDKVYGVAGFAYVNGFVYNKDVWSQAGVTKWPTTPEEFVAALQAIKAKTSATPYYTNYHDGWPLSSWSSVVGSVTCDPKANDKLAASDPWAQGSDLRTGDSLLYDIVKNKLSETDPTTTNWEDSKGAIATGKIATMWLGSWAIVQMQDAAKKAGKDPGVIGYMPFPKQVGGKFCSVVAPDYQYAINTHSKNKPAARAFFDWFIEKSDSAAVNQAVSAVKGAPMPPALQPFTDAGVQFIELSQAESAKLTKIDNASEVGISKPDYRQKLVDTARGAAPGTPEAIFADLSKRWQEAAKTAG
ncbi:ABC transporter substrate-binding protein [Dactylosporangium sucinum]|uniref:Sugar ABC transporter substrate-binding protein n=1 Tax=Dactylosporangium sucinum TaxID=1424081 RepID=A0A917WY14_9ACTN|nr:extracellular solute-binding protein [Dactylosporangium sucinum]GGM40752.1 sugar ABC transporter substrate-binding protein [Dactylosporangium sucinum]